MEEENSDTQKTPVGFPQAKEDNKSSKKILIIVAIILLIGLGAAAWYFLGNRAASPIDGEITPTPFNELPTPSPTPTQAPIEKDEVSINILNGTGISGAAGSLQDDLQDLGYSDIEVGNADSTDYTTAQVSYSSVIPQTIRDEITGLLEDSYKTVETDEGSTGNFDIKIITGIPVNYTPVPTKAPATVTPTVSQTTTTTPTPTGGATSTPSPTPTP